MRNLIVFTKEPVQGRVKTRLASTLGSRAALEIAKAMTADLARELGNFEGEVLWLVDGNPEWLYGLTGRNAATAPQGPGDLGERLARAFRESATWSEGPAGVIGTDCPSMGAQALGILFEAVEQGADASVIPAADGGFAALALKSHAEGIFEGVRMSGPHTLQDLLKKLYALGLKVEILPPMYDVDVEEDLAALFSSSAVKPGSRLALTLYELGIGPGLEPSVPDDLGRPVLLHPGPARILSLVPSVTEMLFDLGAGERVVGRTDYCISPLEAVSALPSVGGPKSLSLERALNLKPDLVFADAEENSREEVEELMAAGVRVFVALPRTLADVSSFLTRAGRLLGVQGPAGEAVRSMEELGGEKSAPTLPALCLVWRDPWMAVTDGTLPGALMEAAGFECLIKTTRERYPRLTAEEMAAWGPRAVLLPSEPYAFTAGDAGEIEKLVPGAAALLFPGEWVTWYGARTAGNIRKLAGLAEKLRRER